MLAALSDPVAIIRIYAVEVLARVGGASQLETLEKILNDDEDPGVRAAADALSRLRLESDG